MKSLKHVSAVLAIIGKTTFAKCSATLALVLLTCSIGVAQSTVRSSPGEPPMSVKNGTATLVGHFVNPQQMLRLAIDLQPPHIADEEQFLQEVMNPGSQQFHHFLSPEDWIARFSPTAADEQAVLDWATSQGLAVTHRYPNRLIVDVEAPVSTIEKALQVKINNYLVDGYTYFANDREPVIPENLARIVVSVGGLHNFPVMHPASFHGTIPPGAVYNPGPVVGAGQSHHMDGSRTQLEKALAAAKRKRQPITSSAYDPTDIYASNAYDYGALQNQGHCCNPNHEAGGSPPQSSIALAVFGNLNYTGTPPNVNFTDVAGFQAQYPYLAYNITQIPIDGGPSTCTVGPGQPCSNDSETALDTEWSTATANSFGSYLDTAHVYVYAGGGSAEDVYNQMLSDANAKVFSTSWSCTEIGGCSGSEMDSRHNIFDMMVGTGWTLMTASGDRGATDDCSTISVSYPAVDPDVIGVGGTALQSGGAGGTFSSEVAWTGGTSSGSCGGNNGGSGGGCSVHYSTPGFQSGSNGSCGTQRSVPDVALNAAVNQNMYFNGSLFGTGGTSISSPMLAGFFAQEGAYLVELANVTGNSCGNHGGSGEPCEPVDGGMGNGNTYLYYFGQNPSYPPHYPFYDITSGCNSNDITAANKYTAFCTGTGYDSVTGWGTANMLQLSWAINTYIAGDFGSPVANFSGPSIGHWNNTNQTVSWTVSDTSANGAVPNGVAGFSQAWDADPGDVTSEATPGSGNSFYTGPQFPNATSGFLTLDNTLEGCHTVHVRTWDNGGTTSDNTYGSVCFDDIPPVVNCGSPDGLWHAADVSIHCTGSDSLSGLAAPGDASFNLTTTVVAGTETASAFTGSHNVLDVAGNSTLAGPIGPNMVDKTNPVITITQPTATNYTHSSTLTLGYTVTDTGSGVGTVTPTMNGSGTVGGSTIVNGLTINLLTALPLGSNTFAITASDNVLNTSSSSVTFTIIVTAASIMSDVAQFKASGGITINTNPLLATLNAAAAYRAAGNCAAAASTYMAFINQVKAQTGKGITPTAAAILIGDAQYLITHCP
jgi:hypothetical protein